MQEQQANLEKTIREATAARLDLQIELEKVFIEAFGINDKNNDVGYTAWATAGADVAVRVARMFIGLRRNTGLYETMCDLIFQLNTNDFWQKNASVIIPAMHIALNAHNDYVMLTAERTMRDEYAINDSLITAAKLAPLDIFPVIAYMVGGSPLMLAQSTKLKQRLAPYFV